MKRFMKEKEKYDDRVDKLPFLIPIDNKLETLLPEIPLRYIPAPTELAAINLSLFVIWSLPIVAQSVNSFSILWKKNLFSTITLPIRLIYELWGGINYAKQTLIQMHTTMDIEKVRIVGSQLLLGSRSNLYFPGGEKIDVAPIHVMEFIRSIEKEYPEIKKIYGFLSESCHPNFLRLSNWTFMGPSVENWSNPLFSYNSHKLIHKTFTALEQSLIGIDIDVKQFINIASLYLASSESREG
ncbi:hypothetical protein [Anaerospora hongkongensis]|uniref:hypothetical protein n=1 Tax=Anaerospora hongkongensis TaxID=244830 RepID=UPI002FDA6F6F